MSFKERIVNWLISGRPHSYVVDHALITRIKVIEETLIKKWDKPLEDEETDKQRIATIWCRLYDIEGKILKMFDEPIDRRNMRESIDLVLRRTVEAEKEILRLRGRVKCLEGYKQGD